VTRVIQARKRQTCKQYSNRGHWHVPYTYERNKQHDKNNTC